MMAFGKVLELLFGRSNEERQPREVKPMEVYCCPICQKRFSVRVNYGLVQSNHLRKHRIDTRKLSVRQVNDDAFLFRYVRGRHRWGKLWGVLYKVLNRWWNM